MTDEPIEMLQYYLTAGAYNSPTAWYKILGVYTIWNFIVLLSIHFSDASSCQPILKLLLDLPIIHEANVEATIAVFRPIAGFSTMSACVWKGPHLPHRVNIHGHWVAWHGGGVREAQREETPGGHWGLRV